MKSSILMLAIVSAGAASAPCQDIDFASLLDELVDRDALPKVAAPAYRLLQSSSYDRASKTPSGPGWYANRDGSGYIRVETNGGRTERVLMDHKGPGAIVRFWATYLAWTFKDGKLRFYFDGAKTPAIEAKLSDVLSGKHLVDGPLSLSVGGFVENGHVLAGRNLYLPLPYAERCKVTYEGDDNPLYFAINYRSYDEGTEIKTFAMSDLKRNASKLAAVQEELFSDRQETRGERRTLSDTTLAPGESVTLRWSGPGAIRELSLSLDAEDHRQALRSTVLTATFDGRQTVWGPVGDFFGVGYQLSPYNSRYHTVTIDGGMTSRWVMPLEEEAKITVRNNGSEPVALREFGCIRSPWEWDERSLYFHARWRLYPEAPSARGRDTCFASIRGRGKYVGDSLAVFSAVGSSEGQPWWGEGDEKVYVDDEPFPSHFGTGTEDCYGYAWVSSAPFSHGLLAQPLAQGNRGRGLTVNSRWRALDAVPFERSFKFDMEIWHCVEGATLDYAPTVHWHGCGDSPTSASLAPGEMSEQTELLEHARHPVRYVDRIEGEGMSISCDQPGRSETHTRPSDNRCSNRSYLNLNGLTAGAQVEAAFFAGNAAAGTLEVALVQSPNAMIVDLLLNGDPLAEGIDLTGEGPSPVVHRVASARFAKGRNRLTVRASDRNANNPGANVVGLDYLRLFPSE